jgi:hypothetical protein
LTTLEASQEDLPLDDVALAQLRKIWDLEEQLAGAWEKVGTEKGRYLVALEHVMSDRRALYG